MVAYQTLALAKHTILSVVQHTLSIPDDEVVAVIMIIEMEIMVIISFPD